MTTTYSPAQTASIVVTTVDTTVGSPTASSLLPTACLYRFSLSTNIYLFEPVYFTATLTAAAGGDGEEFSIVIVDDGDAHTTLSSGTLAATSIPTAYSSLHGSADYYTLATDTITESGEHSFELDLATLTLFLCSSTAPENGFNGNLVLWLIASQESLGQWNTPSLSAYNTLDYSNRDTGGRGLHSSRYSRCPVTGLKIPREQMVLDGYRGILVHPDAYDPPEPEPREWGYESNDSSNEDL